MEKIKKTNRGFILAEGEVTGHSHRILEDILLFQIFNSDNKKLQNLEKNVDLIHEEHETIAIEKESEFEISYVKEYDHFLEESRKVLD